MHHCCWVAWHTTLALLRSQRRNAMILACWGRRVGSYVSKCTIVLRLHDRRRQHCCGAKNAMQWYWVAKANVLGQMCLNAPLLLGCMTDDVSTIVEPKIQWHDIRLLKLMCWVRCVYMHHSGNVNCWIIKEYYIFPMSYVETMNSIQLGY